jgi:Tripartite tricarboxylate transporter family receptor
MAREEDSDKIFSPLPTSIETIRAGKLRALAVTTALRSRALPEIPAVAEFVPGYEASGFVGIGAPRSTPAAIVEKLNKRRQSLPQNRCMNFVSIFSSSFLGAGKWPSGNYCTSPTPRLNSASDRRSLSPFAVKGSRAEIE